MELGALLSYLVFWLINTAVFALLAIGLNLQWGNTGLFNVGIAGFFAVGAYSSVILSAAESAKHLGGFGLPVSASLLGAGIVAALVAIVIGYPVLSLHGDYLAIATLGVAQIIKMVIINEESLTNGVRGIANIPQPLRRLEDFDYNRSYLVLMILVLLAVFFVLRKMTESPWGRCLRAIREDETTTQSSGKNTFRFKMESFAVGAFLMGLSGGLYAHFLGVLSPSAVTDDMLGTFLIWAMLMIGGSGSYAGMILGAFICNGIWTFSEFFTDMLPASMIQSAGAIRAALIGLLWLVIIIRKPEGLVSSRPDNPAP